MKHKGKILAAVAAGVALLTVAATYFGSVTVVSTMHESTNYIHTVMGNHQASVVRKISPSNLVAVQNTVILPRTNLAATVLEGAVRITSGSPGAAKVLTSDADGDATWEAASGGGSSVTNTLLSVGPTNGSVGAKILTAGSNVTFTTESDTNLSMGVHSGKGLSNYALTASIGMPAGKWRGVFCCDSISLNYPTNTTNGTYFQDLDFRYGTNVSVGGQQMTTALAAYTNSIQPWSPRIMGGDTNAFLFLQTGNHDMNAGTNAIDQLLRYSNFVYLAHLDGFKVVAWSLHTHGADTNAPSRIHEKAKFNILLRNQTWWDYYFPFGELFIMPNSTISSDGIHPNNAGCDWLTFGLDTVLRSGERNPLPMYHYIPPRHLEYGYSLQRGVDTMHRMRMSVTGKAIHLVEDEGTSSMAWDEFGNGIRRWYVHSSSGSKAETDLRFSVDTQFKVSVNMIASNAWGAVTAFTTNFTADDGVLSTTNRTTVVVSSDSGTATARTFTLTPGTFTGQELRLIWSGTNAGEIIDDAAQAVSGNHRLSATMTFGQYDVLDLVFDGTDWRETGRSAN